MPSKHKDSHRIVLNSCLILALVGIGIVSYGTVIRATESKKLDGWTKEQAVPSVILVSPTNDNGIQTIELPGRLQPFAQAPIYARVSGYLKKWNADIGAQVKDGQVLGEIETPDLDQQLLQAKADLASAKVGADLANSTAKRWVAMQGTDSVSKQEVDERVGDQAAKQARVNAAQANLDRIQALKGFTKLIAPFNGIVTSRNTDVGALIELGGGSAKPLFVVSDTTKLRLYISVPENYVSSIGKEVVANVSIPGKPGKTYKATYVASSQSVDPNSGSTLFQFMVPNPNAELTAGGFARTKLELGSDAKTLTIPSSALIIRQDGVLVATLGPDNKVVLKSIQVARDLGKTIEVQQGLSVSDRLIDSPPDDISNGLKVRVKGDKV
ncbi:efflux RND transporter periplasmic adaptor subunit [Methylophilus sp. 13]|uniref:efflux RND transporter periplasmic adaptor subunit n=1 Tax=Methylophilus sp. 13 TaxID=2781018 RepID=UPI00188F22E7|nr:efflux RND transporter periplasmic adaptor subunit [Methylophilus sp. 13]MBF5037925.1 efflux RND transporter periplasmic adaptor subunit [Methylophilus sp. 13]